MANVKITELPEILPNDITNLDVLPIVDVDVDVTKKVTVSDLIGLSNILVIDGNESDYYKYYDLFAGGAGILGYSYKLSDTITDLIVKNIEGTTVVSPNSYTLKNLTVTDCTGITEFYPYCPQLESLTIPTGLQGLGVYGNELNGQSFGLSTAPDLTPSESTLTLIEFDTTQVQFTNAGYFQIDNKANVYRVVLGNSFQNNNTLPVGLFNGYTGLTQLSLYNMNLQTIGTGFFSFLGAGNIGLTINLNENALTEQSIDNIITDCLDRATNNGAINISLILNGGTSATPSAQALTDIGTLTGTYGWTISYNP